jgi:hypothetical protein
MEKIKASRIARILTQPSLRMGAALQSSPDPLLEESALRVDGVPFASGPRAAASTRKLRIPSDHPAPSKSRMRQARPARPPCSASRIRGNRHSRVHILRRIPVRVGAPQRAGSRSLAHTRQSPACRPTEARESGDSPAAGIRDSGTSRQPLRVAVGAAQRVTLGAGQHLGPF